MLQSVAFSKNAESVFVSSFTFKPSFHKLSLRKPYKVRFLMEKHGRKFYKNPVLDCRASCDSSDTSTSRKDHTSVHGLSEMIVGVLGGGQLGRMLCQAASKMAIKVMVLDPLENCPASALSYDHMVGSFDDSATVEEFAKRCGVLTVEIEHVDVATLQKLEQQGVDCQPRASTIRIIQDKFLQKVHFSQHGIPLPEFMQIDDLEGARRAGDLFGYPLMIKSKRLAYDGRGNAVAKSEEELSSAISALGGFHRGLYVEKWAPFVKELAVIVARGRDNSILCYPVVETIHKENICHIVKAPAALPWEIKKLANDVAYRAVSSLEGAGVFAVELFLTNDGQILLNEVAPRPHNSGHHTIESCYTSQYEQHLRAVVGLPLGDPSMKSPAAIMYNLLGEDEGERGFHLAHQLIDRALHIPGATVHWYDKPEMRKQRKMGHITIVGPSMGTVEMRLNSMLKEDSSDCQSIDTPRVGIIVSSDSDLHVMKDAERILNMFGVANEVRLVSKHQTMFSYASSAQERGIRVIIAGDGSAAHLPGMVAALTPLPVIGVPLRASTLDGIDSLLSVVQMPRGVPVATVAIDNARSAGVLAAKMLGVNGDVDLLARMSQYLEVAGNDVLTKAEKLQKDVTPHVEIIMGSDSDLPVMKDAAKILSLFDVPHEVRIVSAHRTPELMFSFASSAQKQGTSIIIAGAGGAAHLPGMVAALTPLPVIGVPVRSSALNGIDSLLSIVQMRGDVPVATVAINNATNAGLLAVRMLGVGNADLLARMSQYMKDMKDDVLTKTTKLQEDGWESYLNH